MIEWVFNSCQTPAGQINLCLTAAVIGLMIWKKIKST